MTNRTLAATSADFLPMLAMTLSGLLVVSGCATKTVTFTSNEKATLSLVAATNPDGQGQVLGDTPQTVSAEKIGNKVVKISGAEVHPQFWILSELPGGDTKVQLKLERKAADQTKTNINLKYRMLMKAYKALADQNWALAKELSEELAKLEPEIAAPHIILGIALLRSGSAAEARNALEKARGFDPDDAEISKLIQAIR